MKVYYLSSVVEVGDKVETTQLIYEAVSKLGHRHLLGQEQSVKLNQAKNQEMKDYCRQTIKDLKKADICIFEVSMPSLAIGHLISTALQEYKPVIALYRDGHMPVFLSGLEDERVQLVDYTDGNLVEKIKGAIDLLSGGNDTRFNFFVSPKLVQYLDWVSRTQRIPRSVYLRNLISADKAANQGFQNSAIEEQA